MNSLSPVRLHWSPHWRIELTGDGDLILTAGADRRFALRGIGEDLGTRALSWAAGTLPERLTPDEHRLIDRLVDAGAVRATGSSGRLRLAGDERVLDELLVSPALRDIDLAGHGDLVLMVRTNDTWPAPPAIPHLGVDCSLHHTVVIGPYVIPGRSACTSCLDTRMARRWAPTPAAPMPAVQGHLCVVAHLVAIQVELIARGTSPLVNATIAWDLERGSVSAETLLKMPGCALCDTVNPTGKLPVAAVTTRQAVPA